MAAVPLGDAVDQQHGPGQGAAVHGRGPGLGRAPRATGQTGAGGPRRLQRGGPLASPVFRLAPDLHPQQGNARSSSGGWPPWGTWSIARPDTPRRSPCSMRRPATSFASTSGPRGRWNSCMTGASCSWSRARRPVGHLRGPGRSVAIRVNASLFRREAYGPLIQRPVDSKSEIRAIDDDSGSELWRIAGADTKGYEGATPVRFPRRIGLLPACRRRGPRLAVYTAGAAADSALTDSRSRCGRFAAAS